MIRTKEHFASLYFRFLAAFLFFTLFPVLTFGCLFYINFVRSSKQVFFEQHGFVLENLEHNSTDRFMIGESELLQLAEEKSVHAFRKMTRPGDEVDRIRELDDILTRTKMKLPFVDSIYVFDKSTRALATSISGTYDLDRFYDTQWLSLLDDRYTVTRLPLRRNINDNLADSEIYSTGIFMTPRQVLTLAIANGGGKIIAMNLSNDAMYELLMEQFNYESIKYFITDKSGQVFLAPPGKNQPLPVPEDMDYHRDYGYYSSRDWICLVREDRFYRYILQIPRVLLTKNTRFFLNYVVLISGLLTLLGTILSLLISRILYSPFHDLLGRIRKFAMNEYRYDRTKTRDELYLIKQIFNRLTEDKALLEDRVHIYEKTVRNRHFMDYLDGKTTGCQFSSSLESVNFALDGSCFAILLLDSMNRLAGGNPSPYDRYKTIEVVDTYIGNRGQGLFFDYSRDKYAAVCCAETPEELERIAESVYNLTSEIFQISSYAAMSSVTGNRASLPEIFNEAQRIYDIIRFHGMAGRLYRTGVILTGNTPVLPYPSDRESDLIKRLLNGDASGLDSFFPGLAEYFRSPPLVNPATVRSHVQRMTTALQREFPPLDRDGFFHLVTGQRDLESLMAGLRDICRGILTYVREKGSQDNHYCAQVKDYLETHYQRDINLSVLSDHLNISYPYLSRIFKETTGMNILDYLNGLRIGMAKDILRRKNINLTDIAREVGYNNTQSFLRYFRKFEKMTPGEYRIKERLNG